MRYICYAVVLLYTVSVSKPAFAQCANPDSGDCCAPHLGPGCNDGACCELVCAIHPPCCTSWIGACSNLASFYCPACGGSFGCGSNAAGDCCVANATSHCKNAACCESVCAVDPTCCDAAGGGVWHEGCADLAWKLCPDLPGCSQPPPPQCGDASTGDCCAADGNGSPLCDNAECCQTVCALDPYCCDLSGGEWDGCCAELAAESCPHSTWPDQSICDPPPPSICGPGAGDCCSANGTPGCDDPGCCLPVCAKDPFCCEGQWDWFCADATKFLCQQECSCSGWVCDYLGCEGGCGMGGLKCWCDPICMLFGDCCDDVCEVCAGVWPCPPINPADLTGDNTVGVADLLILLQSWGECPNAHEHCPDPADCPADFDQDGSVGASDLLFLLQNWG